MTSLLTMPVLYGAGAVIVVLLTALGQRQCTVMDLQDQVATAETARDAAALAQGQCELREKVLGEANVRLAQTVTRQNQAFEQWAAADAAAQQQTGTALRDALRTAADDQAKAAWLADLLARERAGAGCAEAVAKVREGLR